MRVYVCTYIYTHVHTYMYTHICIYEMCIFVSLRVYACVGVCTCVSVGRGNLFVYFGVCGREVMCKYLFE